ncbi:Obp99c.2 family protein [Megaselia abdita]
MKSFLVALICVSTVAYIDSATSTVDPTALKLAILRKTCIAMADLDDDHVKQVVTYNYTDDEKMRQYFKCVFENTGLWDMETERFQIDVAVKHYKFDLDEDEVRKIFEVCLNYRTAVLMDWIVPFHKCLAASKVGDKAKKAAEAAKKYMS